jgi:hypothetical protein
VGAYGGLQAEVDSLKRDKNVLMAEVIRLRQAQQAADGELRALHDRVDLNEQRQQQMVSFFAQALQHPALVQHFVASSPAVKRLEDGRRRKKRRGGAAAAAAAGSDSDASDPGGEMGEAGAAAMVVHQPAAAPAAQGLADLAQAFMQMLNTQSAPPQRAASSRQPMRPPSAGPIIEEEGPSFGGGGGGMPAIPPPAGAGAVPMVLGSTPLGDGAGAGGGSSTFGGGPLGGEYVPLPGTDASPIVELPGMSSDSFNLSDLDLEAIHDILPMPSQDLLITDADLARLNEAWNGEMHPPALPGGRAELARGPGGGV